MSLCIIYYINVHTLFYFVCYVTFSLGRRFDNAVRDNLFTVSQIADLRLEIVWICPRYLALTLNNCCKDKSVMKKVGVINPRRNNKSSDQFTASIRGLRIGMTLLQILSKENLRIYWYSVAAGLIMERHDMAKIMNRLGVVVRIACVWSKWISFFENEATIEKLLNNITRNWTELGITDSISQNKPDSKRIIKTYSRTATTIFLYSYLALTIFAVEVFVADSQVRRNPDENNTDHDDLLVLPISCYPLNYKRSSNIQVIT